ncbi:hypothetical protein Poly24_37420 [Rosistilla carotiformis]|uniref:Carboxypeptidase regulatory-like domain-containing protein n=1 Tax=Rosistilla carotiformis TaxID=2528017 RepID=A0A518JWV2_9BACT|nr:hypothetical protein [Rosistilla carotiformis]QDV70023.1 hypothetical protein Poly24_37420 [Rosistilla carotiformis]
MFNRYVAASLCTLALCVSGCGPTKSAPSVRISGTVTLDGKPLETGQISFIPTDGKGNSAGAAVNDGSFDAEVFPGAMRVEIIAPKVTGTRKVYDTPDSPSEDVTEEQIPSRYNVNSTLTLDAALGEDRSDLQFALTSAN